MRLSKKHLKYTREKKNSQNLFLYNNQNFKINYAILKHTNSISKLNDRVQQFDFRKGRNFDIKTYLHSKCQENRNLKQTTISKQSWYQADLRAEKCLPR